MRDYPTAGQPLVASPAAPMFTVGDTVGVPLYLYPAAGAVPRLYNGKMSDIASVLDFGAAGDGVTDDTAAMQAAHNTGQLIYYPAGTYSFSTITMPSGGGIRGDGIGKTILSTTDITAANLITATGASPGIATSAVNIPLFEGFTLEAGVAKATGAGIQIAPGAGETYYPYFQNIHFKQVPIGIDLVSSSRFKVVGCNFVNFAVAGMQISNVNVPDSGDSVITACVFENMAAGGACIIYKSSAGLKVIGNKMNVGTYGMEILWTGAGSGVLVVSGNSIENMSVSGISVTMVGGASFHNLVIVGNEFSLCTDTIVGHNAGILTALISDNLISMNVAGITTGIDFTDASGLCITGNQFRGNGGTPTAIRLTTCDLVDVGINQFIAMSVKTVFVTCTNLFDHNAYSGSTLLQNVTFTTAFTLDLSLGLYEVWAYLPGSLGGGAGTIGTARIGFDDTNLNVIGAELGAAMQIVVAGMNVQLWHNTGIPQTFDWGYRRIA